MVQRRNGEHNKQLINNFFFEHDVTDYQLRIVPCCSSFEIPSECFFQARGNTTPRILLGFVAVRQIYYHRPHQGYTHNTLSAWKLDMLIISIFTVNYGHPPLVRGRR